MIPVTIPFLPPEKEYINKIHSIYQNKWLTNQGPMVTELEKKIKDRFDLPNFQFVTNGTVAIQLALNSLGITEGEIITTPFTYVATISSILWERCKPVFVDIETEHLTIDAKKIEEKITPNTRAILGVHVFGHPCSVEAIEKISQKYSVPVIYDAAHAFGVKLNGRSILTYGDVSTCSFHATKLFHTVEGGGCVCRDEATAKKLDLKKRFGHNFDDHISLGINGKQSEFHAAMGLCNLKYFDEIVSKRKQLSEGYDLLLSSKVKRLKPAKDVEYNFSYYPAIFESERSLKEAIGKLNKLDIFPRRYFYPSLNLLPYISYQDCPKSVDISNRILCLPLYYDLNISDVERISNVINGV